MKATQLFNDVRVTVQRPRPDEQDLLDVPRGTAPDEDGDGGAAATGAADGAATAKTPAQIAEEALAAQRELIVRSEVRDILVEVKERNTGSVNFGVGLGTDSGVFGELSVRQRNFDIADTPETFDELVAGRAFRGAGQQFSMAIAPGNEISTFSLDLLEPHLFETDYSLRGAPQYRVRIYDTFNETRATVPITLSRKLGDFWSVGLTGAYTWVELSEFDPDAAIEVYDDRGPNTLFSGSFFVKRTDVDRQMRPSRGSNTEFTVSQFMGLDDVDSFTVFRTEFAQFFTVTEDLLGNRTILKLSNNLGYIAGDAPTYERFYLGGRSFRGFDFRTISPKATGAVDPTLPPPNEPIGGNWLFFAGAQIENPLVKDSFSLVGFVDSGTVEADVSLESYRVSIGFGFRIYIPQFGPAPLAFDFAVPSSRICSMAM